jgi:hypothetical protein
MNSFILLPDRWTVPDSERSDGASGVLGVDVNGALGASLQAAARTRPALKRMGRNRERDMVRSPMRVS